MERCYSCQDVLGDDGKCYWCDQPLCHYCHTRNMKMDKIKDYNACCECKQKYESQDVCFLIEHNFNSLLEVITVTKEQILKAYVYHEDEDSCDDAKIEWAFADACAGGFEHLAIQIYNLFELPIYHYYYMNCDVITEYKMTKLENMMNITEYK